MMSAREPPLPPKGEAAFGARGSRRPARHRGVAVMGAGGGDMGAGGEDMGAAGEEESHPGDAQMRRGEDRQGGGRHGRARTGAGLGQGPAHPDHRARRLEGTHWGGAAFTPDNHGAITPIRTDLP
ncbi:hypothetical protein ASG63_14715 [Methylobacterium sp. Leaf94]|nr:hypothetical protein ASG63_14715 [Methylobacterium sp. Leaf94]